MKSSREDPDSEANQQATIVNTAYIQWLQKLQKVATKTHSPAPWVCLFSNIWTKGGPPQRALNIHGGSGQEGFAGNAICSVAPVGAVTQTDEANARLIVKSPELLALVIEKVNADCLCQSQGTCWHCRARAVLEEVNSGEICGAD